MNLPLLKGTITADDRERIEKFLKKPSIRRDPDDLVPAENEKTNRDT